MNPFRFSDFMASLITRRSSVKRSLVKQQIAFLTLALACNCGLVGPSWAEPAATSTGTVSDGATTPQQGAVEKTETATQSEREAFKREQIDQAVAHLEQAHVYMRKGDLDLCETELQEAIARAPQLKALHRDYCLLAIAKLRPGLATAEFMMATGLGDAIPYTEQEKQDLNEKAAKLHYRKGITFANKNRWNDAAAEMNRALEYKPQSASIKRSLAFAYGNLGRFDLAEKSYEETFAEDPNDAFSHADFAFLLSEHGKQQSAFDQLVKAVALQPQSAALHVDLAWFAENKGDFSLAASEINAAIKLCPTYGSLWSHLGRVLEHEGKNTEARAAYTKAIALDPGQDQAQAALKRLAAK